jgi:aspartyl aminopeptidase
MRNCKRTAWQKVHGMARFAVQVHDYGGNKLYRWLAARLQLAGMITTMVTMMSVALVSGSL